jgi:hypothetical protein
LQKCYPGEQTTSLEELYPKANRLAVDLAKRILVYDKFKRMTATQALNHPYLADFHSEDDEPVCTQAVDFSFEKLSPSELQGNIHIRTDTRKIIYYYFTELSNDIFLFVAVLMWEFPDSEKEFVVKIKFKQRKDMSSMITEVVIKEDMLVETMLTST